MIFDSINKIFNREPGAVVAATAITTSGTSAYPPAPPIGLAQTQAAYNNAVAQGLSNMGMAGQQHQMQRGCTALYRQCTAM